MERVTVADLKARLSEYLRKVEAGEPLVVIRHGTPVARIERVTAPRLQVRPPRKATGAWWAVKGPPVTLDRDVVDYLTEERADGTWLVEASASSSPVDLAAPPGPGDRSVAPRRGTRGSGRRGA